MNYYATLSSFIMYIVILAINHILTINKTQRRFSFNFKIICISKMYIL